MTGRQISLKGYRIDKSGKLVKASTARDVSARIRERKSKRTRVVRSVRSKEQHHG